MINFILFKKNCILLGIYFSAMSWETRHMYHFPIRDNNLLLQLDWGAVFQPRVHVAPYCLIAVKDG